MITVENVSDYVFETLKDHKPLRVLAEDNPFEKFKLHAALVIYTTSMDYLLANNLGHSDEASEFYNKHICVYETRFHWSDPKEGVKFLRRPETLEYVVDITRRIYDHFDVDKSQN